MAKRDRSIRSSVTEQRIAEGRGKGIGASYNPWLHVQDVATDGRAWRIKDWKTGRDHLCWLHGTSVLKIVELHQYNRSHFPSCLHEKTRRSGNSRAGKPMLDERIYTSLTNQVEK